MALDDPEFKSLFEQEGDPDKENVLPAPDPNAPSNQEEGGKDAQKSSSWQQEGGSTSEAGVMTEGSENPKEGEDGDAGTCTCSC